MTLQGRKIALFVENMYEDLEFWYPKLRLGEEGAEVTAIAPEKTTYTGKHGLPADADAAIGEVSADSFDALVIPGGYSPDFMRRAPAMISFVRDMHGGNKIIAAICHGPWMLASADIINGTRMTSFYSIRDDMVHAGAEWVDEDVVVDGTIISSRTPNDLPVFCRAIIDALSVRD